jgi:ATP-dependent protease ClpP protease subunit
MKEIIVKGIIGLEVFASGIREQLPSGSEKIALLINSPGGDVFEAFEIYNLLKEYPGKVTARVTGLAASAAADLFFGADEREWYTHSAVMYHRAWAIAIGNADDLKKQAGILDSLDRIQAADFAKVTGKPLETALAEFAEETWLIGDGQIRAAGITGSLLDGGDEEPVTEPAAKERVAKALAQLREEGAKNYFSAIGKIAALAKLSKDAPAQAVVNNSPEEAKRMGDKNKKGQEGQEDEENVEEETAGGKEGGNKKPSNEKKAESDRILGILALSGAQIPDDVKQAISSGATPERYAVDALTKQREIEAKLRAENDLRPGAAPQTPGEQAAGPAGAGGAVTESSAKALAKQLSGGRR